MLGSTIDTHHPSAKFFGFIQIRAIPGEMLASYLDASRVPIKLVFTSRWPRMISRDSVFASGGAAEPV